MATYGFHASHEQFPPSEMLDLVRLAEGAGFEAGMCSEHFAPYSLRQGHSGFAWSWLGAAMQATSLSFGLVCSPVGRYHPAVIAQACATIEEMFPGRFWMAVATGIALNEHITGDRWPAKWERRRRTEAAVDIMRRLFAGETVTVEHPVRTEGARLYSRPERPPRLIAAAISAGSAEWAGGWADGLITIARAREEMQQVIDAFRRGGGEGKPLVLQAQHSWAPSEEDALMGAWDQWRSNIVPPPVISELRMPEDFDEVGEQIDPDDVQEDVRVSADLDRHVQWLREDAEMGFDEIYIHNANREQRPFIEAFGKHVLPALGAGTARGEGGAPERQSA